MKLFGIYVDQGTQPDNFIRSTQYARWAWDNWKKQKNMIWILAKYQTH